MYVALRAGAAIYNDGHVHAAHDAWEPTWLDLESGTDDERLLHGLIQFTAAVYHARRRNWEGAVGLATSATEYLSGLPATYRGVGLEPVRGYLAVLAADPAVIERRRPPELTVESATPRLVTLDAAETALAAVVLAEELGYDEDVFETARAYALADLEGGDGSRFVALLFDFVREPKNRGVVAQRLEGHVARRAARERDVDGLF
ncbi:DUF309 domain-containing protein [Natrononativus amylolyticus]|uniref:DUF309 domain-containing protein n=1 Tax=Natrononativus amylolyticus TaxID=2963434 RepID=UPI0020CD3215|nr:DUF309 domain-containing protein [Natrononativus amylolyticus]